MGWLRSGLTALLLLSLQACGESEVGRTDYPPPTAVKVDSSRAGSSYETAGALERRYRGRGYVLIARLGGPEGRPFDDGWPATVDYVKSAVHGIEFTVDGVAHRYPGYTGYEMRVILLRDGDGREYAVVLRSEDRRTPGSGEPES